MLVVVKTDTATMRHPSNEWQHCDEGEKCYGIKFYQYNK